MQTSLQNAFNRNRLNEGKFKELSVNGSIIEALAQPDLTGFYLEPCKAAMIVLFLIEYLS
jgi:hypothetical protein